MTADGFCSSFEQPLRLGGFPHETARRIEGSDEDGDGLDDLAEEHFEGFDEHDDHV